MNQLGLFEPDTKAQVKEIEKRRKSKPLARKSDPVSSHQAAEKIKKSGKKEANIQRVTDLVYSHPGLTSKQLATKTDEMDRHEVARRLSDAEDAGLIHAKGRKEPGEITWWPGEKK